MRNFGYIIMIAIAAGMISCGGAETKVDHQDTTKIDTSNSTPAPEKIPESKDRSGTVDSPINNDRDDILANIDNYLVSEIDVTGNLSVKNTLTDASFQRVIVEISETINSKPGKPNFYTIINLEPGMKKSVKISTVSTNGPLSIHVVKAKSNDLTGGEMVLTGVRYAHQ